MQPETMPEQPVSRKPGQDFGNPSHQYLLSDRVGHKADNDAYTRSKNKPYRRKIAAQKKGK